MSDVKYDPDSYFPVISNLFYLIPLSFALYYRWFYLSMIYISVIITSSLYHICENLDYCSFGWSVYVWRVLDHFCAWYGITLSIIYVIIAEIYKKTKCNSIEDEDVNMTLHAKLDKKVSLIFLPVSCFNFLSFFLPFMRILLLIEILYFSVSEPDSSLIPGITIVITLTIAIIILRIIIMNIRYKKKMKYFCYPKLNYGALVMAFLTLGIASGLYVAPDDKKGTIHGQWHFFGALTGGLFLFSVY